jgi:hypothetical protein
MNKNEVLLTWANIAKCYFESHVTQRFQFLNYYIAVVTAVIIGTYYMNEKMSYIGYILFSIFLLSVTDVIP